MKPALLVVDLQNEFFADGSPALASLRDATEYVNAAIAAFRGANLPVVVVEDVEEPGRVPGSDAFATHASVAVSASDHHVAKRFGNAFWQTELEAHLRAADVDTVIVSGFCAEYCVLDTYRGARERGFRAAILQHGLASPSPENARAVASFCEVISIGMVEALVTRPKA
jgi:nicotinamidase-related amidase